MVIRVEEILNESQSELETYFFIRQINSFFFTRENTKVQKALVVKC